MIKILKTAINVIRLEHAVETGESPQKIFYLLRQLEKYYLNIHPGHREFRVRNGGPLKIDAMIDNEEEAGGQYVVHLYRVEDLRENEYLKLVSQTSMVRIGVLEILTLVIVEFTIDTAADGKTRVSGSIAIGFQNAAMRFLAWMIGTQRIWQRHLEEELAGGLNVIRSKEFLDDYHSCH